MLKFYSTNFSNEFELIVYKLYEFLFSIISCFVKSDELFLLLLT